jgi:hypothetical protein
VLFPEALILPILMVADYLLTIAGAAARDRGYADHFRLEQYELNPRWQDDVARKRWVNPRHIGLTLLVSGGSVAVLESGLVPRDLGAVALGALLAVFGGIVRRHINNLLLFHHIARHPGQVTGSVSFTHAFTLSTSLYQTVMIFVPIALLAAVSLNPWLIGAMLGFGSLAITHLLWSRQAEAVASRRAAEIARSGRR